MTAADFIRKWKDTSLTERSACQQHFLDLCELVGHPKPADIDKTGESFTFERGAHKHGGGDGWADVWKRGFFGWEYKGKRKDLNAAYDQLLKYREALENPPLLVVSDMDRIIVHGNFTNCPATVHEIALADLDSPRALEILRAVFHDPDKLKPGRTSQAMTSEAAEKIASIAQRLRERGEDPKAVACFLDRLVFCMFAEDIGLLQDHLFSKLLEKCKGEPERFGKLIHGLFEAMAEGGDFGMDEIRHFNGALFSDGVVLDLTADEIGALVDAARLDWGAVDPSIFGTLFERGLDPDKRTQLGAHYTSRQDIETLVEPVVMKPLRRKWEATRDEVEKLLARNAETKADGSIKFAPATQSKNRERATQAVGQFLVELSQVRVLDPACGSGNFLYVTLQKLKDFEKAIIVWAGDRNLGNFLPMVHPKQLYGIELSPYAFDLAQMTVWIGYLQWIRVNGYGLPSEPILEKLPDHFQNKDAILDLTDPEHPTEPAWPEVDFIVGNPPFLGDKLMRGSLGDEYVEKLRKQYSDRLPGGIDLCCYWFERARAQIEQGRCKRAGLLATQGIRGGKNRETLKRIKDTGNIFFAVSDRNWVVEGDANVHISMVGFDNSEEQDRLLDGVVVPSIHANLSAASNATEAITRTENAGICYLGVMKAGSFDIPEDMAIQMSHLPNPNGRPNSSVLRPRLTARDILQRACVTWIIDFGCDRTKEEAALYEMPWLHVEKHVLPERQGNRRKRMAEKWWLHGEARPGLRRSLVGLTRFVVTPEVSKHRVFVWLDAVHLADHQTRAFVRADDYFFGVLHSRIHETWARAQGTQLRERESGFRYTPTSCFETFPLPWNPGEEPAGDPLVDAISAAAKELDTLRNNWLNPPEWTKTEVLEFPGSVDGPWARYVHDPDARGIGTVRYPRTVPKDEASAKQLAKRTLTNLYNQRPAWLDHAHRKLDDAVAAAYRATTGDAAWSADMPDEMILEKLLEMNAQQTCAR